MFAIWRSKLMFQCAFVGFGSGFSVRAVGFRYCSRTAGRYDCCCIECPTLYAHWGVFLVRVVSLRSCLRTAGRIGCRWIDCFDHILNCFRQHRWRGYYLSELRRISVFCSLTDDAVPRDEGYVVYCLTPCIMCPNDTSIYKYSRRGCHWKWQHTITSANST